MQLRQLAAMERQAIIDRLQDLERTSRTLEDILANESRQRPIVSEELAAIVDKYGNERRSQIMPADGDLSMEDLIPDEDIVITITRGGYAKRTKADLYRLQKRGGKGVRGAALRATTSSSTSSRRTNHHWLLVLHDRRPGLPDQGVPASGGGQGCEGRHVAGLLVVPARTSRSPRSWPSATTSRRRTSSLPPGAAGEEDQAHRLQLAAAGRVIAINFREDDDELIGAELVNADDDLLLVSRKASRCGSAPTTASCGRWGG